MGQLLELWQIWSLNKKCQNKSTMANQDQTYKGPINIQMTELVRYPTPMPSTRLPVLKQHITVDFQYLRKPRTNQAANEKND